MGKLCYTYHEQQGPIGLNDSNDTKDRQSKECEANKDANPGSSVDVIVFCGFQQRVETMGIRHKEDALCCQGNAAHLRSTSSGNPLDKDSTKKKQRQKKMESAFISLNSVYCQTGTTQPLLCPTLQSLVLYLHRTAGRTHPT